MSKKPIEPIIYTELYECLDFLVKNDLTAKTFPPKRTVKGPLIEIVSGKNSFKPSMLKGLTYCEAFLNIFHGTNFLCQLNDGSLIQLYYHFSTSKNLQSQRLAFYSFPKFLEIEDLSIFPEELNIEHAKSLTYSPLFFRFDFDPSIDHKRSVFHPQSHLTISGLKVCRIPVNSPLTPKRFFKFVLRNFFHGNLDCIDFNFFTSPLLDNTITNDEKKHPYLSF